MVPWGGRETGTSVSWSLVTAPVPHPHSADAGLPGSAGSPGEGASLRMGGTKTITLQPASSVPRNGDLELQQPAQKGGGQRPLLSAHSRGPGPAPLRLSPHHLEPLPRFPNVPTQCGLSCHRTYGSNHTAVPVQGSVHTHQHQQV